MESDVTCNQPVACTGQSLNDATETMSQSASGLGDVIQQTDKSADQTSNPPQEDEISETTEDEIIINTDDTIETTHVVDEKIIASEIIPTHCTF